MADSALPAMSGPDGSAALWGDPADWPQLGLWDAAVVGGGLGGVAAALALAESAGRVVLVEPRTYLGREITATLRPWLQAEEVADLAPDFPLLASLLRAGAGRVGAGLKPAPTSTEAYKETGEIALHPGALKRALEDALLGAGVELLYAALPIAVTLQSGHLSGLLLGSKGGWQWLGCRLVVDATETALVARLAGADLAAPSESQTLYYRTLEFDRVLAYPGPTLRLPDYEHALLLHHGYRGPGHLLVEVPLLLDPAADATRREIAARATTMAVAADLLRDHPAFAGAELAAASPELHGPTARPSSANPIQGLHVLTGVGEYGTGGFETRPYTADPLTALQVGHALGVHLGDGEALADPPTPGVDAVLPAAIPVAETADILVAGGGTSGATAAIVAGRSGANTSLVEMNPGLGGTGTYGGVHSYWFGRRTGFAAELSGWVAEAHEALQQEPPSGPVPRWNIEAKANALLARAEAAGVRLHLNTLVVAPVVEGGEVQSVLVATRTGPLFLPTRLIIDASGDGDVAARAGAPSVYGAQRDGSTMWFSLAQFARPGQTRNNFTSMVRVDEPADYTRAILASRRRGKAGDHDHGLYLAPRESRHVLGEVVLTLTDQLLQRRWPDAVSLAFSNHDVKGPSDSDWIRLGLIPPNLEVEIPYRALLPRGLDNVLVVGKALSATHDALPAVRMQADLENLGGAAALAAVQAIRTGQPLRSLDLPTLQAALEQAGVLPPGTAHRNLDRWQPDEAYLRRLINGLDPARPLHAYSDMEMDAVYHGPIPEVDLCCASPGVVPLLEEAYAGADGDRALLLARLLAMVGSPAGVPSLAAALEEALAGPALPARHDHIRYAGAPPDQGAMPAPVYLLHALGLAADPRALPIWQRVVDLLAQATVEDVASGKQGVFYYVEAVCAGAERLGDPRAAPPLRQLHGYSLFHGLTLPRGFQADPFPERRAFLELLIARALARCGDRLGFVTLIDYLTDARAPLAAHARAELSAIAGLDAGPTPAPWRAWLAAQPEPLPTRPYRPPTAAQQAWGETFCRAAGDADGAQLQPTSLERNLS